MTEQTSSRFVRLPAAALSQLVERCGSLGEPGISAVREAGRVAGAHLYATLASRPEGLPVEEFWRVLDRKLVELQLGSVEVDRADDGLLAVRWQTPESHAPEAPRPGYNDEGKSMERTPGDDGASDDGGRSATHDDVSAHGVASTYTAAEHAKPDGRRRRGGCHFATGLLGGVFSRAAGRPIAVLEVHCGAHAGEPCLFLVSSEARLTTVHRRLTMGTALAEALER
jgi:hypothetical protein